MTRRNLIASLAGFLAAPFSHPKVIRVVVRGTLDREARQQLAAMMAAENPGETAG